MGYEKNIIQLLRNEGIYVQYFLLGTLSTNSRKKTALEIDFDTDRTMNCILAFDKINIYCITIDKNNQWVINKLSRDDIAKIKAPDYIDIKKDAKYFFELAGYNNKKSIAKFIELYGKDEICESKLWKPGIISISINVIVDLIIVYVVYTMAKNSPLEAFGFAASVGLIALAINFASLALPFIRAKKYKPKKKRRKENLSYSYINEIIIESNENSRQEAPTSLIAIAEGKRNLRIKNVQPLSEYRLLIEYEDGEERIFDASCFAKEWEKFNKIIITENGLKWETGQMIDNATIYEESFINSKPNIFAWTSLGSILISIIILFALVFSLEEATFEQYTFYITLAASIVSISFGIIALKTLRRDDPKNRGIASIGITFGGLFMWGHMLVFFRDLFF